MTRVPKNKTVLVKPLQYRHRAVKISRRKLPVTVLQYLYRYKDSVGYIIDVYQDAQSIYPNTLIEAT